MTTTLRFTAAHEENIEPRLAAGALEALQQKEEWKVTLREGKVILQKRKEKKSKNL